MTDMRHYLATAGSFLILATLPASASAQEKSDDAQLGQLRECQAIVDDAARLACYDREVAAVVAASDAGDIQVVDKEDIRETRRGLFGFSLPKTGIFGGGDDKDDEVMTSQITSVRQVGREGYRITIAEGSVWQINDPPRRFRPKVGDDVELERAAMGSFWVRLNGQNGVKGRRVE
jgi:hypothetical protein